jgi:hypothetical protein
MGHGADGAARAQAEQQAGATATAAARNAIFIMDLPFRNALLTARRLMTHRKLLPTSGRTSRPARYWCRSQTPKSWPPFDSADGLITTAPDVLALMVSTISLVAQGPRMVPLSPL